MSGSGILLFIMSNWSEVVASQSVIRWCRVSFNLVPYPPQKNLYSREVDNTTGVERVKKKEKSVPIYALQEHMTILVGCRCSRNGISTLPLTSVLAVYLYFSPILHVEAAFETQK